MDGIVLILLIMFRQITDSSSKNHKKTKNYAVDKSELF
jgi:hypothetical protein